MSSCRMSSCRAWLGISSLCALIGFQASTHSQEKNAAEASVAAAADPLPAGAVMRLGTAQFRHGSRIMTLAYSPNGRILAAGGGDDPVRLWDTNTGKEIRTLRETWVSAVAFTKYGEQIATAGAFKMIRIWDVATGQELGRLEGHAAPIRTLAINSDCSMIASGDHDGKVILWGTFFKGSVIAELKGHAGEITALAFSADDSRLASTSSDRTVRIWDCKNTKLIRSLDAGCAPMAVVFSANRNSLVSAGDDNLLRVWNTEDGKLTRTLKSHGGTVVSLLLSRDGKVISGAHDKTIRVWDLAGAQEARVIERGLGDSDALAISKDGRLVASAGINNAIRIFESATGKEVRTGPGHDAPVASVALSANGKYLITGSATGKFFVWNAKTGEAIRDWSFPTAGEFSFACAPDGQTVVTGGDALRFWNTQTGQEKMLLPGKPGEPPLCLRYSPDGARLAVGRHVGPVDVWDIGQKKVIHQLKHEGPAYALAFSQDGATLAISGGSTIALFDAASGKQIQSISSRRDGPPGSRPVVASLAFSPDGKTIAAGCYDAVIRLLDTATGKEIRGLEGHGNVAYALAFSGDGRTLASGSFDKTVRLWETFSGLQVGVYQGHQGPVTAIAFPKNGRGIVSGSADTSVLAWDTTSLSKGGELPARAMNAAELKAAWLELASLDAGRGHRALWSVVASAPESVPFLGSQIYLLDPKMVDQLFADLNSEQYRVRTDATKELEKYGIWMKGRLQAMFKSPPTLEVQRRVEQMLAKLDVPGSLTIEQERLRVRRIMLALEQMGSPEAVALVDKLADGAPEADLQQEAKASLGRLRQK